MPNVSKTPLSHTDVISGGSDNVCCIQKSCKAPKSITGFCTTIKNCDSIGYAKRVK